MVIKLIFARGVFYNLCDKERSSDLAIKKATGDCIMPPEDIVSRVIRGGKGRKKRCHHRPEKIADPQEKFPPSPRDSFSRPIDEWQAASFWRAARQKLPTPILRQTRTPPVPAPLFLLEKKLFQ